MKTLIILGFRLVFALLIFSGACDISEKDTGKDNKSNSLEDIIGIWISDGFMTKFTPYGELLWSSYFGKINLESIYDIEVYGDELSIAGVLRAGYNTSSAHLGRKYILGTDDAIQQYPCDTLYYEEFDYQDPFVAKFDTETFELKYLTYYCSFGPGAPNATDEWMEGIEYDSKGNLYTMGTEGNNPILKKGSSLEDYSGGLAGNPYIMCLSSDNELSWDAYIGGDKSEHASDFYIDKKDVLWTDIRSTSKNLPEDDRRLNTEGAEIISEFLYRLDIPKMSQWYTYHPFVFRSKSIAANKNVLYQLGLGSLHNLVKNAFQEKYQNPTEIKMDAYFFNIDFTDDFGWTGVEQKNEFEYKLYPNPAIESFYMQSTDEIRHVAIYDIFGNNIFSENLSIPINEIEVNVSNISSGIYMLTVNDNIENAMKLVILK